MEGTGRVDRGEPDHLEPAEPHPRRATRRCDGPRDHDRSRQHSPEQETDDREVSTPDATDAEPGTSILEDPDRPWETYVKLESDREADRFFGSFDDDHPGESGGTATPAEGEPLVTALETPAAEDLGGSAPHWHEQPGTTTAPVDSAESSDAGEADDQGAEHPESDPVEGEDSEPANDGSGDGEPVTGPFGTIGDLAPEWADDARDADDTTEGGEPR